MTSLRNHLLFPLSLVALACSSDDGAAADTAGSSEGSTGGSTGSTTVTPTSTDGSSGSGGSSVGTTGEASTSAADDSAGSDSTTGTGEVWTAPSCAEITGTGAVTFTFDEGATLTPMDQQIQPVTYTFGLVALGRPGALLAGSGGEILASSDAGCSWHSIGDASGQDTAAVVLRAAGDTRAYGFGDNRLLLVRVDDEVITTLVSPTADAGIVGLGVDAGDPDHVRIGDSAGRLFDSTDAGATWNPIGQHAIDVDVLAYRAAFDPADLDHAMFGVMVDGAVVTSNGGDSWDAATGFGAGNANVFNLVFSPAQTDLVWAEGLDLADPEESTSRHIYRSDDGGLTFTAVVDSGDATLYNGNPLFPHPTDPDVLYFVFGSSFQGYGTDVYRYDHTDGSISSTHNMWHDVAAIEFLPGDPGVMYFGLSIEP